MKKGLQILLISDGTANMALGMIGPIYALFVEEIGGNILDASWAYFVFMLTSGVVMYILGRWEDHYKHKEKFVFIGYLILTFGFFSYYFVSTQIMLVFNQALLGLGIAILAPSYDALYSRFVTRNEEASDWATWESMRNIILAIGAVVGGYLVTLFGFKVMFLIMTSIMFVGAIHSLRLFRKDRFLKKS